MLQIFPTAAEDVVFHLLIVGNQVVFEVVKVIYGPRVILGSFRVFIFEFPQKGHEVLVDLAGGLMLVVRKFAVAFS